MDKRCKKGTGKVWEMMHYAYFPPNLIQREVRSLSWGRCRIRATGFKYVWPERFHTERP